MPDTPCFAHSTTAARPIPLEAPVTQTTFPCRRDMKTLASWEVEEVHIIIHSHASDRRVEGSRVRSPLLSGGGRALTRRTVEARNPITTSQDPL